MLFPENIWNSIPNDIEHADTIEKFKTSYGVGIPSTCQTDLRGWKGKKIIIIRFFKHCCYTAMKSLLLIGLLVAVVAATPLKDRLATVDQRYIVVFEVKLTGTRALTFSSKNLRIEINISTCFFFSNILWIFSYGCCWCAHNRLRSLSIVLIRRMGSVHFEGHTHFWPSCPPAMKIFLSRGGGGGGGRGELVHTAFARASKIENCKFHYPSFFYIGV